MKELRIEIPGEPVQWTRPGQGKNGRYTKGPQKEYRQAIQQWTWVAASRARFSLVDPWKGRVVVAGRSTFCSSRGRRATPDVDNLSKIVLDALNKLVWVDDAQVEALDWRKRVKEGEGSTLVVVYLLDEGDEVPW
jgi:Holliday junction resolvase RusA-like endonuclease